mmetsp:Transcript_11634/g.25160  ORF Transcript_11634/g.25160 Transcript_11634/m.25160 type:complete len:87 (-) Transcript_11634:754-1014(-)
MHPAQHPRYHQVRKQQQAAAQQLTRAPSNKNNKKEEEEETRSSLELALFACFAARKTTHDTKTSFARLRQSLSFFLSLSLSLAFCF